MRGVWTGRQASCGERGVAGWLASWAIACLVLMGGHATASAWQADGAKPSSAAETPAEAGAKKRSEPRGRLPAYFGEVIDSQQREKIYELQARYLAEIKMLQEKIAELEKKREDDVRGVLTPEQAEKVKQMAENAKSKRTEASKRKKLAAADAPGEPPARP